MSIRTERVARLMQREIAELLVSEYAEHLPRLVTVTGARTTRDLSIVYVYVSVLGDNDAQRQGTLKQLVELMPRIRTSLAQRIRHQVKAVPELRFFLDDTLENAARIDGIFDRIREERDRREEP
jgi:ribosome-binding factor A